LIKKRFSKESMDGAIQYVGSPLGWLTFGSVSGGLIGAMGLGGSVSFNPTLLKLGVPPRVTSATS
jgi:uncharacterized membrane protein YfcA